MIISKTKELIKKYNNDPATNAELRKAIDKYVKDYKKDDNISNDMDGYDKKSGVPKLTFKIENGFDLKGDLCIVLYDGAQMMREVVIIIVIKKIINDLMRDKEVNKYKNIIKHFHSGDHDEGCLYVKYN